jgi:Cu-Zn family superoxide dismutase
MSVRKWVLVAVTTFPLVACMHAASPPAASAPRASAGAMVKLLNPKGEVAGQAVLTTVPDGVEIVLSVASLTPGLHGIHIHANSSCAPGPDASGKTIDFGAAGGHFDPASTGRHGGPGASGPHHAGDAPNLDVNAQGRANWRHTDTSVTLTPGPNSVLGKAMVVHADPDDYMTNPAGNSGARLLCGIIEPARLDAVIGRAAL